MMLIRKPIIAIITMAVGLLGIWLVQSASATPEGLYDVFLPLVIRQEKSICLGVYPQSYWGQSTLEQGLEHEFATIGDWSGKDLSLAGIFHSIEQHDDFIIDDMFTIIWDAGYTPFVNIYFNASASSIASGGKDADIRAWAQQFKIYSNGGSRTAFLAPMQEMNGNWTPYGSPNPAFYKSAFGRIRQIFSEEGVPSNSAKWVFAPNGWSSTGWPEFESYYPGDNLVDIVGFSSYNFGYHPNNPFKKWETPEVIFIPFIERMLVLAVGKPIMIAQTGTTGYGPAGYSVTLKNQWLEDAYTLLANHSVLCVIYYNANNEYDWAFYREEDANIRFSGYQDGVAHPHYKFIPPLDLIDMVP